MDLVNEVFERCNSESVCNFLLYGAETVGTQTADYNERIKAAYDKLHEWIKKYFPDFEDYDRESSYLHTITVELEKIYMQIGLQAGVMIATDFYKKTGKKD